MKPRITFNIAESGELEIWLNPEGRDLLVMELRNLSETSDHFHLRPQELNGEVPMQSIAYRPSDKVVEWGKVLFRPDQWDAEHFPHVLVADGKSDG